MVLGSHFAAMALTLVSTLAIRPPIRRGSPIPSPSYTSGTAIGGALDMPEPTGPPDSAQRAKELNADQLTVKITNSFGFDLPISYNSNAGSPTIIGNPGAGIFTRAQSTAVAVPRGFAGAIFIGKTYDPANSKIEVSFDEPGGYRPALDVSYVDGYGVPITCSCSGVPVTGCNIPLFDTGRTCKNQGLGDRAICYNPKKLVNDGPADDFFQPCQGTAFTYPNDLTANAYGRCDAGDIQCCVGVPCPAPHQQHGKRDQTLLGLGIGNGSEIPDGLC